MSTMILPWEEVTWYAQVRWGQSFLWPDVGADTDFFRLLQVQANLRFQLDEDALQPPADDCPAGSNIPLVSYTQEIMEFNILNRTVGGTNENSQLSS